MSLEDSLDAAIQKAKKNTLTPTVTDAPANTSDLESNLDAAIQKYKNPDAFVNKPKPTPVDYNSLEFKPVSVRKSTAELEKIAETPQGRASISEADWQRLYFNKSKAADLLNLTPEGRNLTEQFGEKQYKADLPNRPILQKLEPLRQWNERAGDASNRVSYFDDTPTTATTGNKWGDMSADVLGSLAGFINPMAGGGALKAGRVAELFPQLGKVGQGALHGLAGGAAYGTAGGIVQGQSATDTAIRALKEGALFGSMGAGGALGKIPGALAGAGVFGGQTALEGGTPQDIVTQAALGLLLGGAGGAGREVNKPWVADKPAFTETFQAEPVDRIPLRLGTGQQTGGKVHPKWQLPSGEPTIAGLLPVRGPVDFYSGEAGMSKDISSAGRRMIPSGKEEPFGLLPEGTRPDFYAGDAGISADINAAGRKLLPASEQVPLLPDRFVKGQPDFYAGPEGVSTNKDMIALYGQIKPVVDRLFVPGVKPSRDALGRILDQSGVRVAPGQRTELINLLQGLEKSKPQLSPTILQSIKGTNYRQDLADYSETAKSQRELGREMDTIINQETASRYDIEKQAAQANPLWQAIKENGGIKPYKNGYLAEEYRLMPNNIKNKNGITLDEMASTLGYESESSLVADLGNQSARQVPKYSDIKSDVLGDAELGRMPEYQALKKTAEAIDKDIKELERTIAPGDKQKIIKQLDAMERLAKNRIEGRKDRLLSGVPVDTLADYAIIGAAKIAKGTIRFADWSAVMVKELGENVRPHLEHLWKSAKSVYQEQAKTNRFIDRDEVIKRFLDKEKAAEVAGGPNTFGVDPTQLKDIDGPQVYGTDAYRIFEKVYGDKFPEAKKAILDPFDASKKEYIDFQKNWLGKLKTEIVERLGISRGSKLSALVQRYGEGGRRYFDKKKGETILEAYTLEDLKRDAPNDWQMIVEADKWFRKAYDQLIDEVNVVRKQIYPRSPDKIIQKRQDYYRHFRELEGLEGIKNIFETPANIDPNLVAISEFTQPKSRFLGFAQKRGLGPYKEDAVGGFLNYIPAASYAVNIDKHIRVFAKLAGDLSKATKKTKNLNNFINFLRKYAQDLAGKTNPADRFIQEAIPGGRMAFNGIRWLNNRVKANAVLGNVSSALAQLANIPQGIAFAKQHSAEGLARSLRAIVPSENNPMNQSGFLAERYGGPGGAMYRQFDTRIIDQPKKVAAWVMETADKLGTNFVWNSAYSKAVREKASNPVKYADDVTRKLVAGRGIGEMPLIQKSQITQVFFPFTLEVANLWKVQKDFLKDKDFTGLAVLYVANFLFNKVMEQTRGSGVTLDPIQATLDAFPELKPYVGQEMTADDQDITPLQRGGRLAGEVLSNLPAGQYAASLYPEYGTDILGYQLPTRKELFGRNDPTRFGTGVAIVKGLQNPFYRLALPFGGGQLQKTLKGKEAIELGGSYNKDKTKLNYPVDTDPANALSGLLFGPGGFRETKDYYNNNRRPLGENQTRQFQEDVRSGRDPKELYQQLLRDRVIEGIQEEIGKVGQDAKMSEAEKRKKIAELEARVKSIVRQK